MENMIYLTTLIFLLSAFTQASNANSNHSLIALANEVAPYTLADESNRKGFHVELLEEIARRSNITFKIVSVPYARLSKGLMEGSADVSVHFESPDLEKSCCINLGKLHSFKSIVISLSKRPINNITELEYKTLGLPRGAFFDERINKNPRINLFEIVDPKQGLSMLANNRFDAVISSDYIIKFELNRPGFDFSIFSKPFVVNEKNYYLYAQKNLQPEVLARLKKAIQSMNSPAGAGIISKRYN